MTVEERQDMCQRHVQESKEQGQYMYRGDRPHARRHCCRRENSNKMETSIQEKRVSFITKILDFKTLLGKKYLFNKQGMS